MRGHFRLRMASWIVTQLEVEHRVGIVLFWMRGHFRVEGQLEFEQLEDEHGGCVCLIFYCDGT